MKLSQIFGMDLLTLEIELTCYENVDFEKNTASYKSNSLACNFEKFNIYFLFTLYQDTRK